MATEKKPKPLSQRFVKNMGRLAHQVDHEQTRKRLDALEADNKRLREEVDRLKAEPRTYEFHYHPPVFQPVYVPTYPQPWWMNPTAPTIICNASIDEYGNTNTLQVVQ